jgi:hypothetical protein
MNSRLLVELVDHVESSQLVPRRLLLSNLQNSGPKWLNGALFNVPLLLWSVWRFTFSAFALSTRFFRGVICAIYRPDIFKKVNFEKY